MLSNVIMVILAVYLMFAPMIMVLMAKYLMGLISVRENENLKPVKKPAKKKLTRKQKEELAVAEKKLADTMAILENVNNFDGTGFGQKEIK